MTNTYDLLIIGGSAAATTAGIYAARRGLNFKIITKDFGGEVATSGEIGNWPGMDNTNGVILARQFKNHLKFYDVVPEEGIDVKKVIKQNDGTFCIAVKKEEKKMAIDKLPDKSNGALKCDYVAKTAIIATGLRPKELNVPGEREFRNKGLSYCTVCDGPLFGGKTVAIIGGGNSAVEAGLMMADIASKAYIINKNPIFKGEDVLIKKLKEKKNIEIIYNAFTTEIFGGKFVEGLKYKDPEGIKEIAVGGIFVHIGSVPNSSIIPDETEKNEYGEIKINKNCETNIPGLYAAGDVTDTPFKQIVIAAGQGTVAALSAVQYLNKFK